MFNNNLFILFHLGAHNEYLARIEWRAGYVTDTIGQKVLYHE